MTRPLLMIPGPVEVDDQVMGVDGAGQVLTTLAAIEQGLGVTLRAGAGVAAAQARWLQP